MKLAAGEPIDAMDSTSTPTSVETTERATAVDTVKRFADGSIQVFEIQKPAATADGAVAPFAVEGCAKSGTRWTGCSANGWYTAVTLSFKVTMDVGSPTLGKPATIVSYSSPIVQCMVTACSTPTFELIRKTQSGSSPAMVNLVTTWSNIIGTGTTRLSLQVKNGSANTY